MKRETIVLLAFGCIFPALSICSYTQKSATFDEPKHLTTGYVALTLHDYRLDSEGPPLLRIWAALPLRFTKGVNLNTNSVYWLQGDNRDFYHEFLYKQNDADRLLYRARLMIVALGVLLGVLVFAWAHALFGFGTAVAVLAFYTLEPNLFAHSSLVTPDLGVTCFYFGTLYFLWRVSCRFHVGSLLCATALLAAALLTKFSALALIPAVLVLLVVYAVRTRRVGRAILIVLVLTLGSYAAIHAIYAFCHAANVGDYFLPKAYIDGIRSQLGRKSWATFLAGNFSEEGWWYYYLVAFLIKTPVTILLLFAGGLVLCTIDWRNLMQNEVFLLIPLGMFIGGATVMKFNLGLRYVLPIYPLVLLVAGKACAKLLQDGRKGILIALATLALGEFLWVYPHPLAFFNFLVGGPRGGSRMLVDSNLDWGQDLKPLKRWMNDHNVEHINLSYFGTADPAYYGIDYTRMPGYPGPEPFAVPQLPGYVAVSVTNLRGAYLNERGRRFYEPLSRMEPVATVGYSIYVYRVERPWW